MKLSEIGEEALIEHINRVFRLPKAGLGLVVGVGDDTAVLQPDLQGMLILFTTDMLTERMDFLLDSITPYQLGWKAVAANISDIAAMGGMPTWTLASIGFRPDTELEFIDELYRGMIDCITRYGSTLVGGDTNSVKGDAVLSIAQMGKVEQDRLALRSGACIGDRILVTGFLGDSRGGLELLLKYGIEKAVSISQPLIDAHYTPLPRVPESRDAVGTGAVHAMMDLSDGLGADLPKLCKASKVGAVVYADRLPVSDELRYAAGILGMDVTELAAGGGEDFELLLAVAPEDVQTVMDAVERVTGTRVTDIGEIVEGPVEIAYPNGGRKPLSGGWEHFA